LIEQKFRTLSYKELSKMLRLTPLAETISGQELIKDERVAMLTRLIRRKFALSEEMVEAVHEELQRLDLESLQELFDQILEMDAFEQLELWIANRLPEGQA
jgi:hypothetical protein